ncbi:Pkinase domain containing protein, partial [Pyrenophora tritici-repentis]
QAFETESSWFLQLEYSRYTLEEVLNVHTRLEEPHIRVIASSIFLAIKHIAKVGIVHNLISTATIRFCSTGRPLLSNFEECIQVTTESTPNRDLECLGIVVLQCMNGTPKKELRDVVEIRRLRESNKTFGLDNGGKWSGYKLLVDFLDNMFNANVPASAKLEKPHRFIESEPNYGILLPFLELVSLECFALWHAAAVKS